MRAIVVGSGAGGAVAAHELARRGYEVVLLEAGRPFKALTRKVSWLRGLRGSPLLKDETSIKRIFPHYEVTRSSQELVIFRGVTEGGCTSISCGNVVRAENGLNEIGLDLSPEFEEIEKQLAITAIPREKWRPLTQQMYDTSEQLGYSPAPTPKVDDVDKCTGCGYCEVGCATGAKWDSRQLYKHDVGRGVSLLTGCRVKKVVVEGDRACGVIMSRGSSVERLSADVVVLSAGGIGTAQILRASNLPVRDNLWVDVVLTVGGVSKGARMLNEPPMAWFIKRNGYIISPYFDILSYWFHKPWNDVSLGDRVGVMIKLADTEQGTVNVDGTVAKALTPVDYERLAAARIETQAIMEAAGVTGPFVDGMLYGGHLGGTVPLTRDDVETMHPSSLPQDLWVADLSLMPRSQGLPTMLTAAALSLRVVSKIAAEKTR